MKTRLRALAGVLLLGAALAPALRADSPRTIPLQGVLANASRVPLPDGAYPNVSFRLYDHATGPAQLWLETKTVTVAGGHGVFATALGDTTAFPSSVAFSQPYWVSVQVGADAEMAPRLPLRSVPYALNAWSIGGNGGTNPAIQFLGTTDNQPLVLKANGRRAAQFTEAQNPFGSRSVNVLSGSEVNVIGPDVIGSTVGGGGRLNPDNSRSINDMQGSFSVIGGGEGNFVDADYYMVVGGGRGNIAQGLASTIGGGDGNNAQGQWSTIAGGSQNGASGSSAVVAGGNGNVAQGPSAFIGGGSTNYATGSHSVVAGGEGHNAYGSNAFIGGGTRNRAADSGVIAGGYENQATGLRSFIGSGYTNTAATGYDIVIGGGLANSATGSSSAILGGSNNKATKPDTSIGGGKFNEANGDNSAVGGGASNTIGGGYSVISGGDRNTISKSWGTIAGGSLNYVTADGGSLGGGTENVVNALYGTIPGGFRNEVHGHTGFAAGYRAKVYHTGSFVWSDYSADQPFGSQADNQFCIRAKGGVVIESFGNAAIYTGQSTGELNRYLSLLNSYQKPSASGLKAGGILCADDFAYANPAKNDMVVKGKVAVGYAGVTQYMLAVNGATYSFGGYSGSDARYKRNVHTLDGSLASVLSLRGVSFEWDREMWKDRSFPEGRQIGFIAQEVEKVLPGIVSTDDDGYKAVSYQSVIPVLVEAVKTLKAQNDQLGREKDAQIAALQAQNTAMEERLNRLERAIGARAPGRGR